MQTSESGASERTEFIRGLTGGRLLLRLELFVEGRDVPSSLQELGKPK